MSTPKNNWINSTTWVDDTGTVWKQSDTSEDVFDNTWWWYEEKWWKPQTWGEYYASAFWDKFGYAYPAEGTLDTHENVDSGKDDHVNVQWCLNEKFDSTTSKLQTNEDCQDISSHLLQIHNQIQIGDTKSLDEYIKTVAGIHLNVIDVYLSQCMYVPCMYNDIDMVKYMISTFNIDVSFDNYCAFYIACEQGNEQIVKYLLDKTEINVRKQVLLSAMDIAIQNSWTSMIDVLFEHVGDKINASYLRKVMDDTDMTDEDENMFEYALLHVLDNAKLLCSILKEKDFKLNAELLFMAVKFSPFPVYQHITQYVDQYCNDYLAFYLACKYDNHVIVQHMLRDDNFKCRRKVKTEGFEVACKYGHTSTVKVILDETSTEYVTQRGLRLACKYDEMHIVEMLLNTETRKIHPFDVDVYDAIIQLNEKDARGIYGDFFDTLQSITSSDCEHVCFSNDMEFNYNNVGLLMDVCYDQRNSEKANEIIRKCHLFIETEYWFRYACKYDMTPTVKLLSELSYPLHLKSVVFTKCCKYADVNDNVDILTILLTNVTTQHKSEKHVLHCAENHPSILELYLRMQFSQRRLLELAVKRNDLSTVKTLLSFHQNVPNTQNSSLNVVDAFRIACSNGNICIARELVEYLNRLEARA